MVAACAPSPPSCPGNTIDAGGCKSPVKVSHKRPRRRDNIVDDGVFFFFAADAHAAPTPDRLAGRPACPPAHPPHEPRDTVKRALTEDEARFYVSEIVVALEWVHLHGYVYR